TSAKAAALSADSAKNKSVREKRGQSPCLRGTVPFFSDPFSRAVLFRTLYTRFGHEGTARPPFTERPSEASPLVSRRQTHALHPFGTRILGAAEPAGVLSGRRTAKQRSSQRRQEGLQRGNQPAGPATRRRRLHAARARQETVGSHRRTGPRP